MPGGRCSERVHRDGDHDEESDAEYFLALNNQPPPPWPHAQHPPGVGWTTPWRIVCDPFFALLVVLAVGMAVVIIRPPRLPPPLEYRRMPGQLSRALYPRQSTPWFHKKMCAAFDTYGRPDDPLDILAKLVATVVLVRLNPWREEMIRLDAVCMCPRDTLSPWKTFAFNATLEVHRGLDVVMRSGDVCYVTVACLGWKEREHVVEDNYFIFTPVVLSIRQPRESLIAHLRGHDPLSIIVDFCATVVSDILDTLVVTLDAYIS